jgi:hypothetical protein
VLAVLATAPGQFFSLGARAAAHHVTMPAALILFDPDSHSKTRRSSMRSCSARRPRRSPPSRPIPSIWAHSHLHHRSLPPAHLWYAPFKNGIYPRFSFVGGHRDRRHQILSHGVGHRLANPCVHLSRLSKLREHCRAISERGYRVTFVRRDARDE